MNTRFLFKKREFKSLYNCVLYTRKLYYEYLTPVFVQKLPKLKFKRFHIPKLVLRVGFKDF